MACRFVRGACGGLEVNSIGGRCRRGGGFYLYRSHQKTTAAMQRSRHAALTRHAAVLEDEELTPKIMRSFRPWPTALIAALAELDIPATDAQQIAAELSDDRSVPVQPSLPLPPAGATSHTLNAVYINLATRIDRRNAMQAALTGAGLHAVRVEGVHGADVPDSTVCRVWDTTLNAKFDRNTIVRTDLPMSSGERGCAASHVQQWKRCAAANEPLLVLEDDVIFAGANVGVSALALVRAIEESFSASELHMLLYLGADAFIREGAPSLRGNQAIWSARRANTPCILTEAEWAWQTHAYVLWPAAARVLLAGLPMDAPVDVYLSRHLTTRQLSGLVVEPQLAVQLDPYHGGDIEHSSLKGRPDWGSSVSTSARGVCSREPVFAR